MKLLYSIAIGVCLVIGACFLFACNSTKRIQTSQTRVDSVAANVVKELQQKHSLDSASWANEKKQLTETGIVFENDPCPPCDTTKMGGIRDYPGSNNQYTKLPYDPNKIGAFTATGQTTNKLEFYPNGTLKSAEGKIKQLNQKNEDWQKEAYTWKSKYDSLAEKFDSSGVTKNVAIQTKDVVKKVQVIPWWMWVACGLFAVLWIYGLIPKQKKKLI